MDLLAKTDFEKLFDECVKHLCSLIRFKTINPPGEEKQAADYLAEALRAEGIEAEVIETAPGRANTIARIKGDGSERPLLLAGHIDVVDAEPEFWTHDPFGGVVADGFIWGRGALDMKNMVAASLACMIAVKRSGLTPKRDLVFAAVADEEAGCSFGSKWLHENRPEVIDAEYVVGEIGGFSIDMAGKTIYPVQVAEKGTCWIRITADGDPGHGSMPHENNAVGKIGAAAARLASTGLPQHNSKTMEANIRAISEIVGAPNSIVLPLLLRKSFSNFILNNIFPDKGLARTFRANLHNTANPTMLRAGEKINVVPSKASLDVDGRLIPGQTADDFIAEVTEVIGPGYSFEILQNEAPIEGDPTDPFFDLIRKTVSDHDPNGAVVPSQVPGFTDAKFLTKNGAKYFGFSPVKLEPDMKFAELFHGHDERIPVEGYKWGLRVLVDLVGRAIG